jgi:thioredoxin reductase
MPETYDVIIIGAGAAGLSAAIYSARKKLSTLIVSMDVGGQTNLTNRIENYPGAVPQPGHALMETMLEQAEGFGAELVQGKAASISEKTVGGKKVFTTTLADGKKIESRAVIIASGKVPRTLGVPGEEKFFGKGVFTCITCDAPLFARKTVAVIGGGNSAFEGVLELAKIGAAKIYLLVREDKFIADELTAGKVKALAKQKPGVIEILTETVVKEFKGTKLLEKITVENMATKQAKEIAVNGVFLEIGYVVNPSLFKNLVKINEKNEIVIDERCQTNREGVFAAGDVTSAPFKQSSISAGEGAKAALQCHRWLSGVKGGGTAIDW